MDSRRADHLRERLGGRLAYGGDWNPEQWPPEIWQEDVRLMGEAGVNLVSVSPFSWASLEPRPGEFELEWLEHALDVLHAGGIAACLSTGTASPPPWLAHDHPETLPRTVDGVVLWPGGRQAYCPSSPPYRNAAVRLASHLATRLGGHPALAAWHVNNEYGCHVDACYCDISAQHFRRWLQDRYGDIDAVNEAWGTRFWSQRYGTFAEIWPPRRVPAIPNPTQALDFRRFSSHALLECFQLERDELRRRTPDIPVTTNMMGLFKPLDYWEWARQEDLVSDDAYPDPGEPQAAVQAALVDDLMRSLRHGQPWVLMEQAPSAVNWRPHNVPKPPGLMRLWSLMAVARGADGVMFFQWRASRRGAEKFHSAMLPHAGTDSRIFREVSGLGADLRSLQPVAGTRVHAQVCVLLSWESWWGLELGAHPSSGLRLIDQLRSYYVPLHAANVTVDLRPPDADLSAYRLVLAPSLYVLTNDQLQNLAGYVRSGGRLVVSFFSGIVDEDDAVHAGGMQAGLAELLGVRVEEHWPLPSGDPMPLVDAEGRSAGEAELWGEVVHTRGAQTRLRFAGGDLRGMPAVVRNTVGGGTATYLATRPEPMAMAGILADECRAAGVVPAIPTPIPGVEAVRRGQALFLLNHSADEARVPLGEPATSLLDGAVHGQDFVLPPRGVGVLMPAGA